MLKVCAISDPGLIRTVNEDFFLYSVEKKIIIVADGVGGYECGEVASRIAAENCYAYLESDIGQEDSTSSNKPEDMLAKAIVFSNKKVLDEKVQNPFYKKMGTTLCCTYIDECFLYFSYVGDSRVYLIDAVTEEIHQLTNDHVLSQQKLKKDLVPKFHKYSSSILTRMVGANNSVNPESGRVAIKKRDYILTCTDGLSDLVSDEDILKTVIENNSDLNLSLEQLVDKVKAKGARDNVTIVLGQIL